MELDRRKNGFCLINNIPLIRIPYWDLEELTLKKILTNSEYNSSFPFHIYPFANSSTALL